MSVTIYHNPACGTSRNTLAMLRHAGIEPEIIEYLKSPPDRAELETMIRNAGLTPRQAMRDKGDLFDALGLSDPSLSDAALLDAMVANPALINRPFVITEIGTRLCRPSEKLLEILAEGLFATPFSKEASHILG